MTFFWTTSSLLLTGLALLCAAAISCSIWARSGYSPKIGFLEIFRCILVVMALITLNQPEIVQKIKPKERPSLVVLYDTSGSMATQDVFSIEKSNEPITRQKAIADVIDSAPAKSEDPVTKGPWSKIAEKMDLSFDAFSSNLPDPSKGTDLNSALKQAMEHHSNLRGIVLLSDGDWNTGQPPSVAATDLRLKGVPVYAIGVGSQERLPDLELASVDAPTTGVVGKTINIPFRINSWLPRDKDVNVTLKSDQGDYLQKMVRITAMGQIGDDLRWKPEQPGQYELTVDIPVDEGEINKDNNKLAVPIVIHEEELKVLIVESYPRWEYRYLRNALDRDPGVQVDCLLFHPGLEKVGGGKHYLKTFPADSELFAYDVVFLGDVGLATDQLSLENCDKLRQLVAAHAGGLIFLPGIKGNQASLLTTSLADLYPVVMDQTSPRGFGSRTPAQFALTEQGRASLLTRLEPDETDNDKVWRNLPGFQWYAGTQRAKIGSTVLATHNSESTSDGRVPLIVTRTFGTGKLLFMGTDGAWRWRRGVEDLYHYRFWGQVVRWMAYQRNMSQGETMRLFFTPERPNAGDVITLNVNVMDVTGEPLRDGNVAIQITSPSGQIDSVKLKAAGEDAWGLFTGTFQPTEGGVYSLLTSCPENGGQLTSTINVHGVEKEQLGLPANFDVLKEIAAVTKGRLANVDEIQSIIDDISQLPEPEPIVRRYRVWSDPFWGGAFVVMLGAFWTVRKLFGLA